MNDIRLAEVFPPGEFIKDELDARGWTQTDLAEIIARPVQLVNEIISAKRGITPETAKALGDAFGTSAELWLNLESMYRLSRIPDADDAVARRARLYAKAPIKDMVRRSWIEHSDSIDVLERSVIDFLEIESLEQEITPWAHAARKSTSYDEVSPAQTAWLYRARHLARAISAKEFSESSFQKAVVELRTLLYSPEEIRHVPRILAEYGIRFLVVEPLPSTRIDGATFWLNRRSPVVVLSLRFDRIDYFWHTLMHELSHIRNEEGNSSVTLDTDLVGDKATPTQNKPEFEQEADRFAAATLIEEDAMADFIVRTKPLYSKMKIWGFAIRLKIHPGIVVGQLQHMEEIGYSYYRDMLVKVRHIITQTALTDGWGQKLPAGL